MNTYVLIAVGYVLPALIIIYASMLLDDMLTVSDVIVSALPILNIFFAMAGIYMVVTNSKITRKVIWRKK